MKYLKLVMNRFVLLTAFLFLMSCNFENKSTELTREDTINIFNEVLKSKSFLEDHIKEDTIYFIKSKFYNQSYPEKTKHFKVAYIDDILSNKIFNIPYKQTDKRIRLDITSFILRKDTVNFSMVDCGVNMTYQYKLIKLNNAWKIKNESILFTRK